MGVLVSKGISCVSGTCAGIIGILLSRMVARCGGTAVLGGGVGCRMNGQLYDILEQRQFGLRYNCRRKKYLRMMAECSTAIIIMTVIEFCLRNKAPF